MDWFARARGQALPACDPRYASPAELDEAFAAQREHLLWLAEVVTGDAELAEACVVDAHRLSNGSPGMFRDWLVHWARTSTVRSAVCRVHERVASDALKYADLKCKHGGHSPLPSREVDWLKRVTVAEIISRLDMFSRAVLVLRGVQGLALQECALTLGAPRSAVTSAYCRAFDWVSRAAEQEPFVEIHQAPVQIALAGNQ